jgi:hypothetical protein
VTLSRPGRLHVDPDGTVSLDLNDTETLDVTVIRLTAGQRRALEVIAEGDRRGVNVRTSTRTSTPDARGLCVHYRTARRLIDTGLAVDTLGPPDGLKPTDTGRAVLYGVCPVCARPLGPEAHTGHHPGCLNRHQPGGVDCDCPDVHPECCDTCQEEEA